jgi:hypothetical protein
MCGQGRSVHRELSESGTVGLDDFPLKFLVMRKKACVAEAEIERDLNLLRSVDARNVKPVPQSFEQRGA